MINLTYTVRVRALRGCLRHGIDVEVISPPGLVQSNGGGDRIPTIAKVVESFQ